MTAREAPGLVPHLQAHLAELWLGPSCWLDLRSCLQAPKEGGDVWGPPGSACSLLGMAGPQEVTAGFRGGQGVCGDPQVPATVIGL